MTRESFAASGVAPSAATVIEVVTASYSDPRLTTTSYVPGAISTRKRPSAE